MRTYVIISNQRRAFSDTDSGTEDNYLQTRSFRTINADSSRSQSLPDLSRNQTPPRPPQNTPASPLQRAEFECYPSSMKSFLEDVNLTGMSNPPDIGYSPDTERIIEESRSLPFYQDMTIDIFDENNVINDVEKEKSPGQLEEEINIEEINMLPRVQQIRAALRDARDEPEDPHSTVKIVRSALDSSRLESFAVNSPPSPSDGIPGIHPIQPTDILKSSTSESKVTSRIKKEVKRLQPIPENQPNKSKKRSRLVAQLSTTENELNQALCEASGASNLLDSRPVSPMVISPVDDVDDFVRGAGKQILNTLEEESESSPHLRRSTRTRTRPFYASSTSTTSSTRTRRKSRTLPPTPRAPAPRAPSPRPPSPSNTTTYASSTSSRRSARSQSSSRFSSAATSTTSSPSPPRTAARRGRPRSKIPRF